jgi:hypothetical protein
VKKGLYPGPPTLDPRTHTMKTPVCKGDINTWNTKSGLEKEYPWVSEHDMKKVHFPTQSLRKSLAHRVVVV